MSGPYKLLDLAIPPEIERWVKLTDRLAELEKENIGEFSNWICDNFKNEDDIVYRLITTQARQRIFIEEKYIDLIELLIKKGQRPYLPTIYDNINTHLYKRGLFSEEELNDPEFDGLTGAMLNLHNHEFPKTTSFATALLKHPEMKANFMEDLRKYHYIKGSIEYILKYDEINMLREVFNKDNMNTILDLSKSESYNTAHDYIAFAAFYGSKKCYRFLRINGAELTIHTAEMAAFGGHWDILQDCIDHEVPLLPAFRAALQYNRNAMCDYIISIEPRAQQASALNDGDSTNIRAIILAAKYGNNFRVTNNALIMDIPDVLEFYKPMIKKMVSYRSTDGTDSTALALTALYDCANSAAFLLALGAGTEEKDSSGKTPLHVAAGEKNIRAASTLLKHGAKVDALAAGAQTPLRIAAGIGDWRMSELLLKNKANPNARDSSEATPLFVATKIPCARLVRLLVKYGADPNLVSQTWTPLTYAAFSGYADVVRALIESGADVNKRDETGKTPLMAAADGEGDAEVAALLRAAGADTTMKPPSAGDAAVKKAVQRRKQFESTRTTRIGDTTFLIRNFEM